MGQDVYIRNTHVPNIYTQDFKNIKNVKRCRDGMPKSMQTRVGIMHESKGQHIGKAPSLHLFHTAVIDRVLES